MEAVALAIRGLPSPKSAYCRRLPTQIDIRQAARAATRNTENPIATLFPATLLRRSRPSKKPPQNAIAITAEKTLRKLCWFVLIAAPAPHRPSRHYLRYHRRMPTPAQFAISRTFGGIVEILHTAGRTRGFALNLTQASPSSSPMRASRLTSGVPLTYQAAYESRWIFRHASPEAGKRYGTLRMTKV